MMPWGQGWNWGWGGMMLGGGLLMLLLLVGAILVIYFVVRALAHAGSSHPGTPSAGPVGSAGRPLEILKERYARGEITKEQYDQMREDLSK
jgi:putative membrane protein